MGRDEVQRPLFLLFSLYFQSQYKYECLVIPCYPCDCFPRDLMYMYIIYIYLFIYFHLFILFIYLLSLCPIHDSVCIVYVVRKFASFQELCQLIGVVVIECALELYTPACRKKAACSLHVHTN